jgi:hypothetical protein
MTRADIAALADQVGKALAVETRDLVDKRLDARMTLERAFVRELLRVELEPLRLREKRLAEKLAAIEALLPAARKVAR